MKRLIASIVIIASIILLSSFIGYLKSGYTLFNGVYNSDILGSYSTFIGSILGPLTSIVASVLFFYSLKEQQKSINLQTKELLEIQESNNINNDNENFMLLLRELKEINNSLDIIIQYNHETTSAKGYTKLDVIKQLKIYQLNPSLSLKCDSNKGDEKPNQKEYLFCKENDTIVYEGNFCRVLKRPKNEIDYFQELERRIWILTNSLIEGINNSKNKEIQKKVLVSNLNFTYLDVILGIFNQRNTHPDDKIIFEMIELIE
ncbi:hypothetical protein HMPREF1221_00176 [Treponema socranskii subsp. paredis ATCC 35535]|nr:hypothetical protein HMPREF1221_00176 [Treponema socranskii subsp. paredis ATCC 35535]